MDYTKLFHRKKPVPIPYMMFDGWTITPQGFVSPDGTVYTPGTIQLLEWKSAFYDRGKRRDIDFLTVERMDLR